MKQPINRTTLFAMHTALFLICCLCAQSALANDGDMARLEANYTAHYQYKSETMNGDYTETGTVVYYLPRTGDKKAHAVYDIYPERVVDNSCDTVVSKTQPRLEVLKALWPVPTGGTSDKPCTIETADGTTTLTYNLKDNLDADSEKAARAAGLNRDIDSAVVTCILSTSDLTKVSPSDVRSLSETIVSTLNGRQYRRMFGGSPAECTTQIDITFNESTAPAILSQKGAKAMRKREQAEWKSTHK